MIERFDDFRGNFDWNECGDLRGGLTFKETDSLAQLRRLEAFYITMRKINVAMSKRKGEDQDLGYILASQIV